MLDDWDERNEVVAAGSICPIPDCGALVVSYGPQVRTGHDNAKSWCEFACTRCGTDFEVFDRPPDYDTNTDPIVRVTAAEIRKRIDQYYQDPKHGQEIRFFLPSGSYAPQFSWPGYPNGLAVAPSAPPNGSSVITQTVTESEKAKSVPHRWISAKGLLLVLAILVTIAAAGIWWRGSRPTILQEFWAPFVKSPDPPPFLYSRPGAVCKHSAARCRRPAKRDHSSRHHGHRDH